MGAKVQSIISLGGDGIVADIECHLSNSLPQVIIVGFANRAIAEAKERIRGAFAASGLQLPRKRITINLAPADVPKDGSSFDLAIAAVIMGASQQIAHKFSASEALLGELGLDGTLRPVRGIIGKLLAGRAQGVTTYYIPAGNLAPAQLVPGITLIPVTELAGLYQLLRTTDLGQPTESVTTGNGIFAIGHDKPFATPGTITSLADITGQLRAKRALIIAAAGGHNLLLSGPPGTGKSLLAKALPGLLPPLSREEMLEVTHLHSLAGHDYEHIVTQRPFRAPHHSASPTAIVGGGQQLKPGEISLSHRGVLFLDELPEFGRSTLEALRQPLEDRTITVARARDSACYPANFMLVATANPCPCGHYGTSRACNCLPSQVAHYRQRLSGPILDRIDLYTEVSEVEHARLLTQQDPLARASEQDAATQQVRTARECQAARYHSRHKLNSDMNSDDIGHLATIQPEAKALLDTAAARLDLSARAYIRSVKVARTIADIEASSPIATDHIAEALQYRAASINSTR